MRPLTQPRSAEALLARIVRGGCLLAGVTLLFLGSLADLVRHGHFSDFGRMQLAFVALGGLLILLAWKIPAGLLTTLVGPIVNRPGKLLALVAIYALAGLVAVELALAIRGYEPLFDPTRQPESIALAPWWRCDELGCRFDADQARTMPEQLPSGERRFPAEVFFDRLQVVNAEGFHDLDEFVRPEGSEAPDEAGELEILALGDSFAFGFYAPLGEAWLEVCERLLASDARVRLWNTGIPGAATVQQLAVAKRFLPILEPDVVLLGFYPGNDLDGNLFPADNFYASSEGSLFARYKLGPGFEPLAMSPSAAFYRATGIKFRGDLDAVERLLGRTRAGALILRRWAQLHPDIEWLWNRHARRVPTSSQKRGEAEARTEELLGRLRDLVEASGSQLVAVLIPGPGDLEVPGTRYLTGEAILKRSAIETLEVREALVTADYLAGDEHWSSEGHGKIGRIVAEELAERLTE